MLLLAEIDWTSLLGDGPGLPVLMLITVGGVIGLAAIIAPQWRKARESTNDAHLKLRMIERGFTAEEIVSVVNAGASRGRGGTAKLLGLSVLLPERPRTSGGAACDSRTDPRTMSATGPRVWDLRGRIDGRVPAKRRERPCRSGR